MTFQRATKFQSKLRLALAGPAGSGKTYTALTLATALADGQSVALIDTEHGSASKYADLFGFDTLQLETFHPNKYIEAIHEAEAAGYAVLVIDSLSHAWSGVGGLLEVVENITKRSNSKNSFNAWGEATPLQNRLIDTIIRSKLHIIATMRSKTEYVVEVVNGRTSPRKIGMAPVQRGDVEYEFDVYADMDIDNTLIVHKSRCPALSGAVIAKPDGAVAETLKAWLSGETPPQPLQPSSNGAISQNTSSPIQTPSAPPPPAKEASVEENANLLQEIKQSLYHHYQFKPEDQEPKWKTFKVHVLGLPVEDIGLSLPELKRLRDAVKMKIANAKGAA